MLGEKGERITFYVEITIRPDDLELVMIARD